MISIFKNRYKLSLTLATFFILGMGVSLFAIYSLPGSLYLADGYQPEFLNVYVVMAFTFVAGALGLALALGYKKEVLIFRDREMEAAAAKKSETDQSKTTISLEGVIKSLENASKKKEILDAGLNTICKHLEAGQGAGVEHAGEAAEPAEDLGPGRATHVGLHQLDGAVTGLDVHPGGRVGRAAVGHGWARASPAPTPARSVESPSGSVRGRSTRSGSPSTCLPIRSLIGSSTG